MDSIQTGLILSIAAVLVLWALFSFEERRNTRFLGRVRRYADYIVLATAHQVRRIAHYLTVHVMRQVFHYSFHLLLAVVLGVMKRGEQALKGIMRTNKTLARTAERERATRTKLEAIALHKMETALTEEERAAHKDRALHS